MRVRIEGASDDMLELETDAGTDEFNGLSGARGPVVWRGTLSAPDGACLRVVALREDCWRFAVGPKPYADLVPRWPVEFFSGRVEIDAPAGTELIDVWTPHER